jgi:Hypothetical glycosyl hydrolase family 15/Bacterial Ig-like domain (group 2)
MSIRLVRQKTSQGKTRVRPARLHVEELENRIVPSYFPSTADGIHIFEDQLPNDLSSAMTQFVATHIDGTQKELLNQTEQFRAINPNFTVLHYQLGTGNSPYDYIINDQWSSDWSYVNQQESWFAHQSYAGEPQSAGNLTSGRVGNSTGWDQADIANPAWQQYTLNQVLQNMAATGSNGWFADSFTYGLGGAGYDGTIPSRYQGTNAANPADWPGGVTWTDQFANWAQTIETAFAQYNATNGTDYQFIPNLDARVTSWEPDWYDNANGVPIIDGAFLEGFGQYTDTYDWTLSMNQGLNLTDNGKIVIMQPYPSASPTTASGQQQINFLLGTYLLLKGDQTYLNIDYGGGVQYYPQYELNLGSAVTPLQSNVSGYLWNGVYRRDFQNGFVLVNPGSTTYTLNLGGNYRLVQGTGGGTMTDADLDANGNYIGASLTYKQVNSITLTGGSAAIFLNGSLAVAQPAQAAANPVTAASVGLTVLGQENGSGNGLTYTWSSSGPASVKFSDTGDNTAQNVTATFAQAGAYTLTATISDGSQSVTSSVQVTVDQTLTSLEVSPASTDLIDNATVQFSATALDQFGLPLASQPNFTWSIDAGGVGTVDSNGLYTAPAAGLGSASVRAADGTTSAAATVNVVTATATYVKANTISQGNWQGSYGGDGYDIMGGPADDPSYATVTASGESSKMWARSTTSVRALSEPAGGRIAAAWYAANTFLVDINLTDGQTHQVALYLLDWNGGRRERIDVLNAAGAVLDSRTVSSFTRGQYQVWDIAGDVTFRFTRLAGAGAVLSGLFFSGPVPGAATFVAADTTDQGNWQGTYGAQGYNVIGAAASNPSYAAVVPSRKSQYVWTRSTTDVRALSNPAGGRIAAAWYAPSFTVNVNVTDGQTHQLALYFLDWAKTGRKERIDVLNASGQVLDTHTISSFSGGQYEIWNISGDVTFRITSLSGANALLSGVFFG